MSGPGLPTGDVGEGEGRGWGEEREGGGEKNEKSEETVQYSIIQFRAVQYSIIQYITV